MTRRFCRSCGDEVCGLVWCSCCWRQFLKGAALTAGASLMARIIGFFILLLVLATPAAAEENPLGWRAHRKAADVVSTGAVGLQLSAETWKAFRAEDRGRALRCQALRVGLTVGTAELTKRLVHRTRPDGSDQKSFFSEHTALATVNGGWRFSLSVPIAIGVGYLRPAANKHFLTDVAFGAGVGALMRQVCGDTR